MKYYYSTYPLRRTTKGVIYAYLFNERMLQKQYKLLYFHSN